MIIYDFPSGDVIVDTEQWSWSENAYEWGLYLKRKKEQQDVTEQDDFYSMDDIPF